MLDRVRIPKGIDLEKRLEEIKKNISISMGIRLNNSDAFRVLIWKHDKSTVKLNEKELLKILTKK